MQFGFLGIRYKEAPLEVRDKTSFTDSQKIDFFRKIEQAGIEQCMILSTCNRSEVYFFMPYSASDCDCACDCAQMVRKLFEETFSAVDLSNYLVAKTGTDAYEYFFRVTAGLESLVIGEDQILGQVVDAADFSRTMGYSGKELNKVVRDAVSCAKRIKTELKISEKPLSVSYVGIQQLLARGGIEGKTVLVIGSGKTATLALTYIYEYAAKKIYACNRTLAHAKMLREQFPDLTVVEYANRYDVMQSCDIVVSATASPHLVVRASEFTATRPVIFLDLATPRDIDISLQSLPDVQLLNLDTLQRIVANNEKERLALVSASEEIVASALEETLEWLRVSQMDGTIASLQQRCGEIVEDSYEYLDHKLELSHRDQKIVRKVLNASLQRLLREPIQELKHLDTTEEQEKYKEIVRQLFQI